MGGLTKNNMNKNIGIVIGIIVLVVAGGVYISMNSESDTAMMQKNNENAVELSAQDKVMAEKKEELQDKEVMMKAGSYEAYAPEKVALASSTHAVVLFFRAKTGPCSDAGH